MATAADKPLTVQSDCSILLEVNAQHADVARAALAPFAELVKSPEHVHTYRLTPLSIWNARSTGIEAEQMVAALREHAATRYHRTLSKRSSSCQRDTGGWSSPAMATFYAALARTNSPPSALRGTRRQVHI